MRDLIEKLNQLQRNEIKISEAPVQPGERKGISFKLKKLEKLSNELEKYKGSLHSMKYMDLPPALKTEMKQIEEKLNAEIDKVSQAYQTEYEKSKTNDRPVKMDNLFKALAKNCKEIIKVYKELNKNNFSREKFLFRGIRSSDDALYGKPFEARKPKDSNRELHELVNDAIKKLGFDSNRENSMFVTGDRSQAAGYGYGLYIMFPVDGFTFTWSQTVKDLVLDSSKKLEMLDKDVVAKIREIVKQTRDADPANAPITYPEELFTSGYNYEHDRERLMGAVDAGKLPDEIEDLLDDILTNESIQTHFEFTDQDLFRAILSGKEIYVKGNYYAINMEHKDELFKFLEDINTDNVILPEYFGEMPDVLDRGDVVRILSGQQAGKLGTITYTYTDSYDVYVTAKTGDVTLKKEQVELYKLPDGSIPIYEKNDKVIVIDPDIRIYGEVATITFVNPSGKVDITTKNGNYHSIYKNQIEKYTPEREQEILKDLETRPPTIEVDDLVVVSDPDSEFYKRRGKVNYIYNTGAIEVYLQNSGDYIEFQPSQLTLIDNATPDLLPKEEGVFNVGDKVQVTDGEWKGYYGKVEYLYSNGDKAEIDLVGLDKKIDVWLSEIVHTDQESSPTDTGGIKVGDSVIVSDPKSEYFNKIGTVTAKLATGNVQIKVGNKLKAFSIYDLAPANSSADIKVGDTIEVTNNESGYYGSVGTVVEVGQDSAGKKWIKFKNDQLYGGVKTFVDWVEKVSSPEKSVETFKPNDKFKIKDKSYMVDGSIATVLDGPDADGDYKAVTDDGKIVFTAIHQMEKLDAASPASFNEGDVVKITDKSSGYYGDIGEIESGPDADGDYVVRFRGGDWSYYQPDAMEKIEKPSSQSTSDEIDNLTWTPEPEVTAPATNTTVEQFTQGDKVEVVSGFPSLLGKTGTIMQVSPNYDFVSVQLDGNNVASSFPSSALKKIDQAQPEFKLGDLVEVTNPNVGSYGVQGHVTDQDINMLVIQDTETNKVFFVKKASVKKIG